MSHTYSEQSSIYCPVGCNRIHKQLKPHPKIGIDIAEFRATLQEEKIHWSSDHSHKSSIKQLADDDTNADYNVSDADDGSLTARKISKRDCNDNSAPVDQQKDNHGPCLRICHVIKLHRNKKKKQGSCGTTNGIKLESVVD
jgi:hypothetical protein